MNLRFFCLCVVVLALSQGDHAFTAGPTYRGGLVTPPLPKPRFTLTDTSGAPFDFWRQTDGYVTLLFFGYTRCPDECPMHVSNIAQGLKKLPAGAGDRVKLVFVTTDPARDTPKVLRAWLNQFDTLVATMQSVTRISWLPTRKTIWRT